MSTKIDNGKVKIEVCGKTIEIEVRNGKFVKPKELLQVVGRGSALKPAVEPIAVFGKSDVETDAAMLKSNPLYYTAKAGSKERNFGCENLFWLRGDDGSLKEISKSEYDSAFKKNESHKEDKSYVAIPISQGNCHATVKPLELMRYLCRLVKQPSDNLILDPFLGSGTTACACVLEGCDFVGIDRDAVAVRIANERIKYWSQHAKDKQKNAQPELPL